jgi:GR25 family glycosyltransferase involved in LPS biosynthesis
MDTITWPKELQPVIIITMGDARRMERICKIMFPMMQFCWVLPCVKGSELDLKDLQKSGLYKPIDQWNVLTSGQVGCFMSHKLAWKHIVEKNLQSALILEDDATSDFSALKMACLERVMNRLRSASGEWNVLYLGRNNRMINDRKRFTPDIVAPGRSWGLFAYAVSRSGAQQLIRQSRTITDAVDIFVSTCSMPGRFAITPNVFDVHDDGVSDTQQRRVRPPTGANKSCPVNQKQIMLR